MRTLPRTKWTSSMKRHNSIGNMTAFTHLHRRILHGAATAIFAASIYPIMNPSTITEGIQLHDNDPLVKKARDIAHRTGVKNYENVQVYLSHDGETGGSLGANLFGRGTICISELVYRGFHFEGEDEEAIWDDEELPTKEEVEFIIAHECVHLAKNHSLVMSSFVPIAMISSASFASKFHNKFVSTLIGVGALAIGSLYLSWCMEYEADHGAASLGDSFHRGGLITLERTRQKNCILKNIVNSKWITDDGNYLGDTAHPWLTTRIDHLMHLDCGGECAFCSLLVTNFKY